MINYCYIIILTIIIILTYKLYMLIYKCLKFKTRIKNIKHTSKMFFSDSNNINKNSNLKETSLNNFSLDYNKDTNFNNFYNQTISNSNILSESLNNDKLSDRIKSQGLEKTQEEIQNLQSLIKEKNIGNVR